MNGHRTQRGRIKLAVGAIAVLLVLVACAGGSAKILSNVGNSINGSGDQQFSGAEPAPAASAAPAADSVTGSAVGQQYTAGTVDPANLLVIKTGTIGLQVTAVDPALASAAAKITGLGGYLAGSARSGDGPDATAMATYRIPAAHFDEALVALRGLAIKVLNEQTQTQEVTGQVVDLAARITNLQATEAALQAIMTKAVKISDVLAVQDQLTQVRGQIEELSAQKKQLEGQAAYSTLAVTFSLQPVTAVVVTQTGYNPGSEIDHASASLVGIGQTLLTAGIWLVIVGLPVLVGVLLVLLLAFVLTRLVRRLYRRPSAVSPGGEG